VEADPFFVRAIELDPGYVHAHAWRAIALNIKYLLDERQDTLDAALACAQTALALDDNDAWAAELAQFDDAWRSVGDAMSAVETTKERLCEAEVHRVAGEIALRSPEPDAVKAEAYFERALAVAHEQQAKSWELRAAMSLARLWRDQAKRQQAGDLLAPIYGWFTEGFDTLDLKEARALLDELRP
jgi:tetratricopeptide (TPR) repeat protein